MKTKTNKLSKKAQMEIIGLVIIVLLITLGMLFLAIFAFKDEPVKKVFTREGLAYSTMSAIMKTTSDECTPNYPALGDRLIEDCTLNPQDLNIPSTFSCNNQHSCEFFRETTERLLQETLGQWGKRYEFHSDILSTFGGQAEPIIEPIISERGGCPATRERDTSGLFPIQSDVGLIENVLYICE